MGGSRPGGAGPFARVLAVWIAACLVVGVIATRSHHPSTTAVDVTTGPTRRPVSVDPSTTTTTATSVASDPAAVVDPGSPQPQPSPPLSKAGTNDGSIGTVLDLGPRPVEQRAAVPCVPLADGSVGSLVVLDVGSNCARVLATSDEWAGADVSWAPDGSWLLTTLNLDVMRIAADGSWRQDLGGGQQAESAALSPDGSRLAITGNVPCCYKSQKRVVVVANSDGTGAAVAQDDIGRVPQTPVWSRDSQRFAYVNQPPAGTPFDAMYLHVFAATGEELASRSFEGRGPTNLNSGQQDAGLIGRPEWLSDGSLIAPVVIQSPNSMSLYWFNADLSDAAGPGNPDSLAFEPLSSSPDGRSVLYRGHDRDNGNFTTQVWLLNRFDGATRLIVPTGTAPSWAPDGVRFAYASTDPSSSEPWAAKTITIGDLNGSATPLWTPSSMRCYCWLQSAPLWSPDGGRLAITTH